MKKLTFTIIGNQEDRRGNAIPYHRTTQGSYWNPASKRYNAWKMYVVAAYLDCGNPAHPRTALDGKPIVLSGPARMDIKIWWHNNTHADADNIFKGIADAIFKNDKLLRSGSFESEVSDDGFGKVEVTIELYDK